MLQRLEIGTREHLLLWLADKPTDETFEWQSTECATATYAKEQYGEINRRCETKDLCELDVMARDLASADGTRSSEGQAVTWGALYDRARKAWA